MILLSYMHHPLKTVDFLREREREREREQSFNLKKFPSYFFKSGLSSAVCLPAGKLSRRECFVISEIAEKRTEGFRQRFRTVGGIVGEVPQEFRAFGYVVGGVPAEVPNLRRCCRRGSVGVPCLRKCCRRGFGEDFKPSYN